MKKRKKFDIGLLYKNKKQPESAVKKRARKLKLKFKKGRLKVWNKNKHLSKKHKERLRQTNVETWKNPELKKSMSEILKKRWKNPQYRKNISRKISLFRRKNKD